MIKAVLFDLDGVLVDACEWHYVSLNRALNLVSGFVIDRHEHETTYNGLPTKKKLEMLIAEGRLPADKIQAVWDLKQDLTKTTINELAAVDFEKQNLLAHLKLRGIKLACVTNSIYETAAMMLDKTGQLSYMDLLITNDMIRRPKPHGEGYIQAMVRFGSLPDETLIVEDSPKGLEAAHSTGSCIWQVSGPADVTLNGIKKHLG